MEEQKPRSLMDLEDFAKADMTIGPTDKWPDGKVRPHRVKTVKGEIVALTDEEFDRLVTAARHKYYANKQGARKAPRTVLKAGDTIKLLLENSEGYWAARVEDVKVDGRIRVATRGLEAGMRLRAGVELFIVTSAGENVARLRMVI